MSETKHTPGPWEVTTGPSGYNVITGDQFGAVCVVSRPLGPDYQANTKLIMAAPELLAFVKKVLPYLNAPGTNGNRYVHEGKALIEKAEK